LNEKGFWSPASFILVGSGNPEEGEFSLLDRFGDAEIGTVEEPDLKRSNC
jgi:Mg-chelatase subunit ChlI